MAITDVEMADLVREVCYDVGAGPLVLGGPLSGYRAFADAVGEGAEFPYVIVGIADPSQWEAGTGALDEGGRLVRWPAASSANGMAVDFTAGEKRIGLALHAAWAQAVEDHGHPMAKIAGLDAALADKQAANANLSAIAGQASAADRLSYWTGAGAAGLTPLSAQGRAMIGAADAGAARAAMGLVIGSDVQPFDADLAAIAASPTTAYGRGTLTQADAAGLRSYIGAGTSSTTGTVTSVAMNGGTTGLTVAGGPVTGSGSLTLGGTLAIGSGGTGAASAASARANLGLAIGSDVQGWSANLAALSGLTTVADRIAYWTGGGTAALATLTGFGRSLIDDADAATARGTLGLGSIATQASASVSITGGGVTGLASLGVTRAGAASAVAIPLAADAGYSVGLNFQTGSLNRWSVGRTNGAESGGNAGSDLIVNRYSDSGVFLGTAISVGRASGNIVIEGHAYPSTDNGRSLGLGSQRWSVLYAGTSAINTSDARDKRDIAAVDDPLLDAWGEVQWRRYRFCDAFEEKGDGARWHFGLVAQQVRDAIDGRLGPGAAVRLGLLCHDAWEASPQECDAQGTIVQPARAAGDRWGLRYEECFAVEAAWQRRRIDRIEAMIGGGDDAAG